MASACSTGQTALIGEPQIHGRSKKRTIGLVKLGGISNDVLGKVRPTSDIGDACQSGI